MITIILSEPEARALIQLMQLLVQRGCDMGAAEAAIVINRRVAEAIGASSVPKPNGAAVAKEDAR